ncbi:MAG: hypothetical protein OEZ35_02200 [Candidatus Bathyarchaeota archaeon]|nr:hypothetical protein [Candidatus Bathyarchaeota archaeon]MDH5782469.1 hypothetical protein [Candidatus Bathyarchaeota archaeon]
MSEKKLSEEELLERIDELLNVLKMISRDLGEVSKSLKTAAVPSAPEIHAAPTAPTPASAVGTRGVEDVKMLFSRDLEDMLSFDEKGEFIVVKPRQYLGSDNFAKIASIIRDAGGEYISAGKQSHFRVPKEMT